MNQLIKITETNGKKAVSARELYQFLSIDDGSHFAEWGRRNIEELFIENIDYQSLRYVGENGGRPGIDYALSLDCAKHVSMMSRCEKGKQARQYFIEMEKVAVQSAPVLPKDYLSALKALVASEEARQLAETQVKELEPKAEIYDQIANANNLLTLNNAAKAIGIGRNKLMEMMRHRLYLRSDNTPYQAHINAGYFEVKVKPLPYGGNYIQTLVTGKGLVWLKSKFNELKTA